MHITITGKLGSGKSTVAKKLVERYGFEIFSTGAILRAAAAERGMDLLELNKELNSKLDSDRSMDDLIDNTTIRVAAERKNDKLIFDSRMAWHFVPGAFKVFVTVDPRVAAERVMKDHFSYVDGDGHTLSTCGGGDDCLATADTGDNAVFVNLCNGFTI